MRAYIGRNMFPLARSQDKVGKIKFLLYMRISTKWWTVRIIKNKSIPLKASVHMRNQIFYRHDRWSSRHFWLHLLSVISIETIISTLAREMFQRFIIAEIYIQHTWDSRQKICASSCPTHKPKNINNTELLIV